MKSCTDPLQSERLPLTLFEGEAARSHCSRTNVSTITYARVAGHQRPPTPVRVWAPCRHRGQRSAADSPQGRAALLSCNSGVSAVLICISNKRAGSDVVEGHGTTPNGTQSRESATDTLVASAWVHDIGYGPRVRDSGYHPLDGAQYLRREGWPEAVCDLVAHHSGSRFVAHVRGLDDQLRAFNFVEDALSDALTVADNTAGRGGTVMTVEVVTRQAQTPRTDPTRGPPAPTRSATTTFARPPGGWLHRLAALGQRDSGLAGFYDHPG